MCETKSCQNLYGVLGVVAFSVVHFDNLKRDNPNYFWSLSLWNNRLETDTISGLLLFALTRISSTTFLDLTI